MFFFPQKNILKLNTDTLRQRNVEKLKPIITSLSTMISMVVISETPPQPLFICGPEFKVFLHKVIQTAQTSSHFLIKTIYRGNQSGGGQGILHSVIQGFSGSKSFSCAF